MTARRWRIGDEVLRPWRTRRHATQVIGGWHRAVVVAIRGDRVIVRCFGHEYEHPGYELRPVVHERAIDRRRTP